MPIRTVSSSTVYSVGFSFRFVFFRYYVINIICSLLSAPSTCMQTESFVVSFY